MRPILTLIIEIETGERYATTLRSAPRDAIDLEIEAYYLASVMGCDPCDVVRHGFALCDTRTALGNPNAVRWA